MTSTPSSTQNNQNDSSAHATNGSRYSYCRLTPIPAYSYSDNNCDNCTNTSPIVSSLLSRSKFSQLCHNCHSDYEQSASSSKQQQQHQKQLNGDDNEMEIAPAGYVQLQEYPTSILSIDVGQENLGLCLLEICPSWIIENDKYEKQLAEPTSLLPKSSEPYIMPPAIPIYNIVHWCKVNLAPEQKITASEEGGTTANGLPLNTSQQKRRLKKLQASQKSLVQQQQTSSSKDGTGDEKRVDVSNVVVKTTHLSENDMVERISTSISAFIRTYNVKFVFLENQLEQATKNRFIQHVISATVFATHAARLITLAPLQKFDFCSEKLNFIKTRLIQLEMDRQSKGLKKISSLIVANILDSAFHYANESTGVARDNYSKHNQSFNDVKYLQNRQELIQKRFGNSDTNNNNHIQNESGMIDTDETSSKESSFTSTAALSKRNKLAGVRFDELGIPFINPFSLVNYEMDYARMDKTDDLADSLLQAISQMPNIICNIMAQRRAAKYYNHTLFQNALAKAKTSGLSIPDHLASIEDEKLVK